MAKIDMMTTIKEHQILDNAFLKARESLFD